MCPGPIERSRELVLSWEPAAAPTTAEVAECRLGASIPRAGRGILGCRCNVRVTVRCPTVDISLTCIKMANGMHDREPGTMRYRLPRIWHTPLWAGTVETL